MRIRVAVLLAVALSACAPPARHFPPADELRALIEARVQKRQAVGLALGVIEADGSATVVFAGSAGAGARPLGPRTGFEIGSVTKTFTGALLVDMARTGEVRISDPVARHLPDSVRVAREITLLGLATHHSGLPAMPDNMAPADHTNPYADYSVGQMYAFLSGQPVDTNPSYQYSNIGFGLLGHALARAAGTSYEQLARERLLAPLGMSQTSIALRGELGEHMAKGHNRRGGAVPYWDLPTLAGAGAFRSNMTDMMAYLAANLREPASDLERSMHATHRLQHTVSDSTGMGIAWQLRTVGGRRIVWKDGGTAGFQTFVGFDPERRVGVVVLANSALEVDDIGFHLIDRGLPLVEPPSIPRRIELPASVLRAYAGEYEYGPGASVVVTLENGRLFAQDTGDHRYPIFAETRTRFFYDVADAWITFVRDGEGAVTGLVFSQNGDEKPARKVR